MVPPKNYGIAHTNYGDNFVFAKKKLFDPLYGGSKHCINLDLNGKIN